jgi:Phage derived protein Gp49-like (DUF891)
MAIWSFLCYMSMADCDVIDAWYRAQDGEVRGKIDALLEHLGNRPRNEWRRPHFDVLSGVCQGLAEIRIKARSGQYRMLGYFGPEHITFTFLNGSRKRTSPTLIMPAGLLKSDERKFRTMYPAPESVASHRFARLAPKLADKSYRDSYVSTQLRTWLADQVRALRGDLTQTEFGKLIGKPQTVISRLEDPDYGKLTLETLLDVASKLDIALLVRFVDHVTFLVATNDFSESALRPAPYNQQAINALAHQFVSPDRQALNVQVASGTTIAAAPIQTIIAAAPIQTTIAAAPIQNVQTWTDIGSLDYGDTFHDYARRYMMSILPTVAKTRDDHVG